MVQNYHNAPQLWKYFFIQICGSDGQANTEITVDIYIFAKTEFIT